MAGLGKLDSLAYNLMRDLVNEFGGTGKIEIKTQSGGGGFSGDPTYITTTYDNIAITPQSPFETNTQTDTPIASGLVSTYVSADNCPAQPIAEQSYLTIYKGDFITKDVINKRMKITSVNPVMGGNFIAGYELICEGSH